MRLARIKQNSGLSRTRSNMSSTESLRLSVCSDLSQAKSIVQNGGPSLERSPSSETMFTTEQRFRTEKVNEYKFQLPTMYQKDTTTLKNSPSVNRIMNDTRLYAIKELKKKLHVVKPGPSDYETDRYHNFVKKHRLKPIPAIGKI